MTPSWKRWGVRVLKLVLILLVLFFIGKQCQADIAKLKDSRLDWRPGWMLLCTALYLVSLGAPAWFWRHLLTFFGYQTPWFPSLRAHYIGQLGKYVPGKALAIAIRAELIHPHGVPYGVSIISSTYEVLTGMTAGAMVAALLFIIDPPNATDLPTFGFNFTWHPMWLGVALIVACGVPLIPGVFNFVIARMTAKIQAIQLYRLPPVGYGTLAFGLIVNAAGWCVQGFAWWAALYAVLPTPPELTPSTWAQCTASIAFASVAGFATMIPGGLVVREAILRMLLSALGAGEDLLAAAIVLRLNWIATEALFALCTYWINPKPAGVPAGSLVTNP